ncbi:MAG: hypothetical protein AAB740_00140 [Patescibacteria group bacterium]
MKKVIDIISDENETSKPVWLQKNEGKRKKLVSSKRPTKPAQKSKKKHLRKRRLALPQISIVVLALMVASLAFLAVWFTLNPKLSLTLRQ